MTKKTNRFDTLENGQRLTIVIEAEQLRRLRLRAWENGYSVGRVVRQLIARGLGSAGGRS